MDLLVADVEMPDEAQDEDDPLADPLVADVEMPDEAQQEDDPLAIEEDIAELEHGYAQSGEAVPGDAMSAQIGSGLSIPQPQAPLKVDQGNQTEMPGRHKATQTKERQKRGRDKAVQTKEELSERAQLRAQEQKVAALQKENRSLKVRCIPKRVEANAATDFGF